MPRRLSSISTALLLALILPGSAPSRPARADSGAPVVEVHISGPRLIHLGKKLDFKVTVTNRSTRPIAVRFPVYFMDDTRLDWRITDANQRLLPPYEYHGPDRFFCPVTGPLTDWMITVLQPGEMTETNAGDPSDSFAFKGKGFYRVSLRYVLDPTSRAVIDKFRPPDEQPGPYTPEQRVEMLGNMPRIDVTSNEWLMYMAD